MKLVEGHRRAGIDKTEQVGRHAPVVGLVQIAVAQLERIAEDYDRAGTHTLQVGDDVWADAEQRDLVRGRPEGLGVVTARDPLHALHHRPGGGDSRHAHQRRDPLHAERTVELRIARLACVNQDATLSHPRSRVGCLARAEGADRRQDDHEAVRGWRRERTGDLFCRVAHRRREQHQRRGAIRGVAVGAVLRRVRMLLPDDDCTEQGEENDCAGDPRARSPHAAFSTGARNCSATAAARP